MMVFMVWFSWTVGFFLTPAGRGAPGFANGRPQAFEEATMALWMARLKDFLPIGFAEANFPEEAHPIFFGHLMFHDLWWLVC